METLAYLHLACENELPEVHSVRELNPFKLNWQKFSSAACLQLLSLLVGVAIAGFSTAAMAQSVLQQGDEGAAVIDLQNRLRSAGCFDGSSTGFFGEQTREAVIRCQTRLGLEPDGIAGPATLNALAQGADVPTSNFGTPSYGDLLQIGDSGEAVRSVQQRLQDLGYYYGAVDGVFGSELQRAVLQFQRDRGLSQDGVVGPQVYAALQQGNPTPPIGEVPNNGELSIGDQGARVTALQQNLNNAGYPTTVDGIYGEGTRASVIAFQRDRRLPVTGIADSQTLAALGVDSNVGDRPNQSRRYAVIIPTPDRNALARVQQVIPTAVARTDRRGNYVLAGTFVTSEAADRRSQQLRSRGLDARVIFQ